VTYFMSRVQLLTTHGASPLIVFDGGRLPIKGNEEESRRRWVCCNSCTRWHNRLASSCSVLLTTACRACPCARPKTLLLLTQPTKRRARREARAKAAAHMAAGNTAAALDCYQRAVDVTPAMARQVRLGVHTSALCT